MPPRLHPCQRFFQRAHVSQPALHQVNKAKISLIPKMNGSSDLRPFKYYWPFKKSFFVFFRNIPDARGRYMGQAGYGYVSFERFWGRQQYVEEINSKFEHHQFPDKTCPTGLWRLLQKSTRAKRLQLILTSTSPQVPWPFPETMISPFFLFF